MFLSQEDIQKIGFKEVGREVQISSHAVFYNPANISIGDYSRIDDFTVLSGAGKITTGRYVHISCHCSIVGQGDMYMGDYSGLSSRVSVFTSTDSYDGKFMTNPCVPAYVRNTVHASVYLCDHVVIGAGSVVLPGVFLARGCAVGAMSLVKDRHMQELQILWGVPAKVMRERSQRIYLLENKLNDEISGVS